jgi:hypothetical protein
MSAVEVRSRSPNEVFDATSCSETHNVRPELERVTVATYPSRCGGWLRCAAPLQTRGAIGIQPPSRPVTTMRWRARPLSQRLRLLPRPGK